MKAKIKLISENILRNCNVDITKYDLTFLSNLINKRMVENALQKETEYFKLIQNDVEEQKIFVSLLQVSYTEFFRNSLTYAILEKIVFPNLILNKLKSGKKELRIWSVACAGGHEVYSMAILLNELLESIHADVNIRIFGTDISDAQIEFAKKGQFSESALNNVSLKRLNQWFSKDANVYTISDKIKKDIEFSTFDLLSVNCVCPPSSIFGDFDLIICANILFYFSPEIQNKIIDKSFKCMKTNGFFVTGETERDLMLKRTYNEIYPNSAIFVKY